jgi:hypothetical protein
MANSLSASRLALVGLGSAALLAGCGGGGSGGGVEPPSGLILIKEIPIVSKVDTAIGLAGSRGSGADVLVAFNVKDREFNPVSIQIEYGWDVDGDGDVDGAGDLPGSDPSPSPTDEYFPCTEALGSDGRGAWRRAGRPRRSAARRAARRSKRRAAPSILHTRRRGR